MGYTRADRRITVPRVNNLNSSSAYFFGVEENVCALLTRDADRSETVFGVETDIVARLLSVEQVLLVDALVDFFDFCLVLVGSEQDVGRFGLDEFGDLS